MKNIYIFLTVTIRCINNPVGPWGSEGCLWNCICRGLSQVIQVLYKGTNWSSSASFGPHFICQVQSSCSHSGILRLTCSAPLMGSRLTWNMGTVSHCGVGGLSYRVVVDHLRDGVEGSAELSQDVLATSSELDPHVHEPVAAPGHVEVNKKYRNCCKTLPSHEGDKKTEDQTRGKRSGSNKKWNFAYLGSELTGLLTMLHSFYISTQNTALQRAVTHGRDWSPRQILPR